MKAFRTTRLLVIGLLPVFSAINVILGITLLIDPEIRIAISYLDYSGNALPGSGVVNSSSSGSALVIAISALTLLVTVPGFGFRLINRIEYERFLTSAWIELCWTVLLAILWFAAALYNSITSVSTTLDAGDTLSDIKISCTGSCGAAKALIGFAWANTLILVTYIVALSGLILVSQIQQKSGVAIDTDDPVFPELRTPRNVANQDFDPERGISSPPVTGTSPDAANQHFNPESGTPGPPIPMKHFPAVPDQNDMQQAPQLPPH